MDKIPIHLNNPFTGVFERANGFITGKNYYDGRNNLNAKHLTCNVYSSEPHSCVHNIKCGWCGESNKCIPGTSAGPLSNCLRNSFFYNSPSAEWNPFRGSTLNVLAVNKKGQALNHIVPEPDMNKVDVKNPYH
jgi:hypothetical protein